MTKNLLRRASLTVAISTAIISSQLAFAADVEVSLPDAASAFTVDQPAGTELMRVNGDGNVGIGIASPGATLHIANPEPSILIQDTDALATDLAKVGFIHFRDSAGDTTGFIGDGSGSTNDMQISAGVGQQLRLYTNGTSGIDSQKMIINTDGKVGIGTTAPITNLHLNFTNDTVLVDPSTGVAVDPASTGGLLVENSSTVRGSGAVVRLKSNVTGGAEAGIAGRSTTTDKNGRSALDLWTEHPDGTRLPRMTVNYDGNVGIGTTSPTEKLEVDGKIQVTAGNDVCIDGGACLSTAVGGGGGKFVDGANATDAIYTAGNVGIGTTTPEATLEVVKAGSPSLNIRSIDENEDVYLRFIESDGVDRFGMNLHYEAVIGKLEFEDHSTGKDLMVVERTGEVGIGTNSPVGQLEVFSDPITAAGTISSSGTTVTGTGTQFGTEFFTGALIVANGEERRVIAQSSDTSLTLDSAFSADLSGANFIYKEVAMYVDKTTGNVGLGFDQPGAAKLSVMGQIQASFSGSAAQPSYGVNDTNSGFFRPASNSIGVSTNGIERMRFDDSGNVGIGTANPGINLDISGSDASSAGVGIRLTNTDGAMSNWTMASRGDLGADSYVIRENSPSTKDRFTIQSGGNVGIGTNAPTAGLHVSKGVNNDWAAIISNPGGDGQGLSVRGSDANGSQTTPVFEVTNNLNTTSFMRVQENGRVGIGVSNPSTTLHISGSLTQNSDERLKKDITPLKGSLERITQLQGVSFNWKDADRHEKGIQLGLIAQAVEKIIPEVVSTSNDEQGTKSVAYTSLIAVLIEGMKEQQKRIEALEAKLK